MTTPRAALCLLLMPSLLATSAVRVDAASQGTDAAKTSQQALFLNASSDGQTISAKVGQQIEVTLSAGPHPYGDPLISSPAVRFENVALSMPITPGIHPQVYIFQAVVEGAALLQIPRNDAHGGFTVTIDVLASGTRPLPSAKPDQTNPAPWTSGWTNLVNNVQQSFTPSLPTLASVEVEFVLANPGPTEGTVTATLLSADGQSLAMMWKSVRADDCARVRFFLPGGGLHVAPGQKYRLQLSGDTLFGWKYTAGGYQRGQAWFNGKPLLPNARSSFLFRTFGAP